MTDQLHFHSHCVPVPGTNLPGTGWVKRAWHREPAQYHESKTIIGFIHPLLCPSVGGAYGLDHCLIRRFVLSE